MPRLKHFYGQNHLHYLTDNTYRKARIFDSDRYKRKLRAGADPRLLGSAMSRRDTSEGSASSGGYAAAILCSSMPIYHRTYSPGELQFITSSTYRRAQVFRSPRFCQCFVERLEEVWQKMNCLLVGWVQMGEWFLTPFSPGSGLDVQTDDIQKYTDHAVHLNIVSPP